MSSTTSSDCESCDCSQCTYSLEHNHNDYRTHMKSSYHVPIYATMARPLIYYAQVNQPLNRRQNKDQHRKDNPFKKAFKWYTQERTLCNKNEAAPEKCGFANWLDNKYLQYLRESGQQTEQTPPLPREPRPTMCVAEPCQDPCPAGTNKFGRIKGPWIKRRQSSNDAGDVPEKCPAGSCEYILKPKDITRAASENVYHTPTSGGKSTDTMASSNMKCCNMKCSGRSHSLSDLGREKSVPKHGNNEPYITQAGAKAEKPGSKKAAAASCECDEEISKKKLLDWYYREKEVQVPSKGQHLTHQPGQSCCPCPRHAQNVEEVKAIPPKVQEEKIPQIVKVSSQVQEEKVPEVVQVPSTAPATQLPPQQEKVPETVQVPPTAPTIQPPPQQEKVPEIAKVSSKEQKQTNQQGPCCKCEQIKMPEVVPQIVQVPSQQSRPVEESSQCPEVKALPVNEETQYEPASKPPTSMQNLRPCCCNTCHKPTPPPRPPPPVLCCIPVQVQNRKISSADMCLKINPSAQNTAPKKHKKGKQLSVSSQCAEVNKCIVINQNEQNICLKDTATSPHNCQEVSQVFGPTCIQRQSCSTVAKNEGTGECGIGKEVAVVRKLTRCVTCASNDAAQTSDHSIRFEKDGPCSCQHPLFFKIIYTDLNEK